MTGQEEAKLVSRRKAVSLLAFAAATSFAALTSSDAEAQTAETAGTHGMQRRHTRRGSRHERRHARRTGHAPAAMPPAGAPAK
jgi:hypothetical protein